MKPLFALVRSINSPKREIWTVEKCYRYCKIFNNGKLETVCPYFRDYPQEKVDDFQYKICCTRNKLTIK